MSILSYRDAFVDYQSIASKCLFESCCRHPAPRISIVIPTYLRPDLLKQAIESCLNQLSYTSYEIVIVDNDETQSTFLSVRDFLTSITDRNIRYFVNDKNIGMFGNWNRCIELARGEWVTILNDDDILHQQYLRCMLSVIDNQHDDIDGITCRQNEFYRDKNTYHPNPALLWTDIRLAIRRMRFDRSGLMRITPKKLYFGNDLRNSLGFLFKRQVAIALGGYKQEDYPASDYLFYVRFASQFKLFWYHRTLASIGIGDNESMNVKTSMQYVEKCARLRSEMAGHLVPASWERMNADLSSYAMANMERVWNIKLDWPAAEKMLSFYLPRPSINKVRYLRIRHGGY